MRVGPALPHPVPRAGEGRRTYRGCPLRPLGGERDTGTFRSARCRHPPPHTRRQRFREAAGPTTHSPAEASCGMRSGSPSSSWGLEPWSGSLHCPGSSAGARPSAAFCLRPLPVPGGSAGRAHLEGPHGSRGGGCCPRHGES